MHTVCCSGCQVDVSQHALDRIGVSQHALGRDGLPRGVCPGGLSSQWVSTQGGVCLGGLPGGVSQHALGRGCLPQCMLVYTPLPVNRNLYTRLWKHYLSATTLQMVMIRSFLNYELRKIFKLFKRSPKVKWYVNKNEVNYPSLNTCQIISVRKAWECNTRCATREVLGSQVQSPLEETFFPKFILFYFVYLRENSNKSMVLSVWNCLNIIKCLSVSLLHCISHHTGCENDMRFFTSV